MSALVFVGEDDRRWRFFDEAARAKGLSFVRLTYEQAFEASGNGALDAVRWIRLEAPTGETCTRLLLRLGAEADDPAGLKTERVSPQVQWTPGEIVAPRQWFLGYRRLLHAMNAALPDTSWVNHPEDVTKMFDKTETHRELESRGLPVPNAGYGLTTYEEVKTWMLKHQRAQVFVKIRNGSSASGVVALRRASEGRVVAHSSARMEGKNTLRNHLRLSRYTREHDVARLINRLGAIGGLHVEEWVPKRGHAGGSCDLRVVVIDNKPGHAVVRVGRGPMSNLHLGNRRGDLDTFKASLRPDTWGRVEQLAGAVMVAFPRTLYAGLDILIEPGRERLKVIEVNAFGDLLPGILSAGLTTYESQVDALLSRS